MVIHPVVYGFFRVWAAIGVFLTALIILVGFGFLDVAVNI